MRFTISNQIKCVAIVLLLLLQGRVGAQSTAELTFSQSQWTTKINETTVYQGNNLADAIQKAINDMGPGVINIRNSGNLTKRVNLGANQTLDFHNNEINSSGNFRGLHVNGITIRNLHMTGSPLHSLSFHGCSDIHLHNIKLEFSGPAGGIRVDNDRYSNLVITKNLKVTGEMYIQNTRGHGFETYTIDGIEIEQIEAHNTVGCGLLLNDSRNAVIGSVIGTYNNQDGGYATFRVANTNGPNITVESVYSRFSGRGVFSVSGSGGCVIQHVDIANSTRQGVFLEDAHNTFIMSGTVVNGSPNIQLVRTQNCGVYVNGAVPPPPGPTEVLIGSGVFFEDLIVYETDNAENWNVMTNLSEGQTVFGDRTFTYATIPLSLQGSEWIQTAMNSRAFTYVDPYANFKMKKSGTVYIAHSDRVTTKPQWLSAYNLTDMSIVVQENATTQRTLSIYKKDVSVGETVQLGINSNNGTTASLMYLVAFSENEATSLIENDLASSFEIFPNPFSQNTNVSFELQQSTEVEVNLYYINGSFITTMDSGVKSAGSYSVILEGSSLPSGVYIVSFKTGNNPMQYRKVILK